LVQKSEGRVARFFLAQYTNTGKIYQITTNLPNAHNIFEMAVIYSKWQYNTYTNMVRERVYIHTGGSDLTLHQTQIGIFGLKIYHQETLEPEGAHNYKINKFI
jgi:hypothetical protein